MSFFDAVKKITKSLVARSPDPEWLARNENLLRVEGFREPGIHHAVAAVHMIHREVFGFPLNNDEITNRALLYTESSLGDYLLIFIRNCESEIIRLMDADKDRSAQIASQYLGSGVNRFFNNIAKFGRSFVSDEEMRSHMIDVEEMVDDYTDRLQMLEWLLEIRKGLHLAPPLYAEDVPRLNPALLGYHIPDPSEFPSDRKFQLIIGGKKDSLRVLVQPSPLAELEAEGLLDRTTYKTCVDELTAAAERRPTAIPHSSGADNVFEFDPFRRKRPIKPFEERPLGVTYLNLPKEP